MCSSDLWQVVQKALYDQDKARTRAILSWINWGEFYYIVKRRVGAAVLTNDPEFQSVEDLIKIRWLTK